MQALLLVHHAVYLAGGRVHSHDGAGVTVEGGHNGLANFRVLTSRIVFCDGCASGWLHGVVVRNGATQCSEAAGFGAFSGPGKSAATAGGTPAGTSGGSALYFCFTAGSPGGRTFLGCCKGCWHGHYAGQYDQTHRNDKRTFSDEPHVKTLLRNN